jgi:hypothetical protein
VAGRTWDADDTLDKTRKKALDSTTTTKEVERYWVQASRGTLQAAARLCEVRAQTKILDMEMAEIFRKRCYAAVRTAGG